MGNTVTCSLVDVVGIVTVTQADGQILEFVQPIFASHVKKLHPGNWLVHYMSVQDPVSRRHHGKMSMLQGNEELQSGQIYFLLPIPSHFSKEIFDPNFSKQQRSGSSKSVFPPATVSPLPPPAPKSVFPAAAATVSPLPPPAPKSQQQAARVDFSTGRTSRQEPTPVFSLPGSFGPQQHPHVQPARPHRRSSKQHKIQLCDWEPTLMTIEEAY